MRRTSRVHALTGAAVLACTVGLSLTATAASAAPGRGALTTSRPTWAQSSALRRAASAGDVVHARVYLPWRDQASLDALTAAVSTPGSPQYGAFLTAQQFRSRFAPTQKDVTAVQQWLRGAGLTIADTPDNGHYVAVEGTVAQAEAAFGTTLGLYSAYGQTLRAPETVPSVPAALTGVVSAVVGLDDSTLLLTGNASTGNDPKQVHGAPGVGFRAGQPCAPYYGASSVTTPAPVYGSPTTPLAPCGYTPAQVRGLYGLASTDTGAGQTVAFVGANASPTIVADVTTYSRKHGLPDPKIQQRVAPGVYKHPDTPRQVPGDYYGEQTLDAEAIHSTAPDATLLYVASSNANQDFDAAVNSIVDKHLASIISISYGFGGEGVPQGFINSLDKTFQQAVATGVGVFVSSGDNGDEAATGTLQPDFYADDPYVTAVGGTSAAIVPSTGSAGRLGGAGTSALTAAADWTREFEVGWQTGLAPVTGGTITPTTSGAPTYTLTGTIGALPGTLNGGAGGGTSRLFAEPAYQQAAGITASGRSVPDVSALADPNTGLLVGQTQSFPEGTLYDEYRIGGTSLSAPLMAGIAAVANQRAGTPLGFLNPLIYRAYARGAGSSTTPSATASTTPLYDPDQADLGSTPAVVRVNYADDVSPAGGRTYSIRTLEADPLTTLDTVRDYDGSTGVGTPNGNAFLTALTGR
ncbi:S53 family peptidase [Kineococcus rubinsiae]|uniref:S53 family peptidase n=1 Tax=Kineococcus rubinsiae TaxID=2609562 RepID=UPI001431D085|nr:S53 family peptidase [Kineococcus rubinsiae]NIZ91184.1 S8/S53 family peptidase [Kineococcus rubinsiae]